MTGTATTQAGGRERSGLAVGLAFLAMLAFFWPTLWSFPARWANYMHHGWLVAGLVAWVIWRDRAELLRGQGGDLALLMPLAALSLLWLAATVAHIQVFHQAAFVLLLVVWGVVVFGGASARPLAVLGATAVLALPVWEVLIPILRPITTLAGGGLVKLLRIPTEIEGYLIHIPAGTFLVDDACAGLNTLLAGLAIGVLYAHILVKGVRAQFAVVAVAAAIAIIGNWIRVATVVVIGHFTSMEAWVVESHYGLGWGIFTISLVPFFIVARKIEIRSSRKRAAAGTSPAADTEADSHETEEEPPGLPRRAVVASLVAVVGPALYFGVGALPAADTEEPSLSSFPHGAEWQAAAAPAVRLHAWRPAYQGEERHDSLGFTDGDAYVFADRFVYRKQRQGAKLIGYPNRIAPSPDVLDDRVIGPVDPAGRRWVRQAIISTPEGLILTWYWYRVGGIETYSAVHAKALELPAFVRRHRSAELYAFSAPCAPGDCREALATLASFMGARRLDPSGRPSAGEEDTPR